MSRADELGRLLSREEGKPLAEGRGEVFRAGQFFTYYAAECLRQLGENADSVRPGVEIDVRRGTGGHGGRHLALEFSHRNGGLENRAGSVLRQRRRLEAGQCHTGIRHSLVRNHRPGRIFRAACFPWSWGPEAALDKALWRVRRSTRFPLPARCRSERALPRRRFQNLTKVQMEMGSKNALAVMDDADLDLAVSVALGGAFGGTGQKCTASSRIVCP